MPGTARSNEDGHRPWLPSMGMSDTRPLPQPDVPGASPGNDQPGNDQPGNDQPGDGQLTRRRPASRRRRYVKRAVITLGVLITLLVIGGASLWIATPSVGDAVQLAEQEAAAHGIPYPGPPVPANFARPLVATEDHRFYGEPGVDVLAVGRVVWSKVTNGSDQGGATLEQQLAKMLYTSGETGFIAETKQVVLAVKLNATYSKQQILAMYAEVAYYGHGYYGLEQASCGYFGHPASDLTVVQGAMLAGVVNAPSLDDPISDPASARARLEHVVARMVAVGDLTQAQANGVLSEPLGIVSRDQAGC
jgi:membrane peptidoglycan carboxypeptidase